MSDKDVEVQPAPRLAVVEKHPSTRETVTELFARVLKDSGERPDSMIVVWFNENDTGRLHKTQIGTNGSALWLLAQAQLSVLRG